MWKDACTWKAIGEDMGSVGAFPPEDESPVIVAGDSLCQRSREVRREGTPYVFMSYLRHGCHERGMGELAGAECVDGESWWLVVGVGVTRYRSQAREYMEEERRGWWMFSVEIWNVEIAAPRTHTVTYTLVDWSFGAMTPFSSIAGGPTTSTRAPLYSAPPTLPPSTESLDASPVLTRH